MKDLHTHIHTEMLIHIEIPNLDTFIGPQEVEMKTPFFKV